MPIFDPRIDQAGAQSLADLMGGGSAAQYLGGQQMMIEQMNDVNKNLSLADLDKVTIANDHQRTMNPMLQQVQRGLVREADSKTPEYFTGMRQGELGDARTKIAQAKLKEGTLNTDIEAGNNKNQTQMIQDMGKNMLNMIGYVGNLPGGPAAQREAMSQLIASHGLDRNPATRAIWDRLLDSPDMLKQGEKLATQMMNLNPDHLSRASISAADNASKEKVAAGNNAASRYASDARQRGDAVDAEKFKREWMKAGDDRKASWLRELAATSSNGMVETPLGTIPVQAALAEAKRLEAQYKSNKAAGALVTDARTRALIGMPEAGASGPNGNGTNGLIQLPGGGTARRIE